MTAEASRIDGLFELAFRRHQAGQLREAEELYRSILQADPRQLDCLYYLGMIALQDGRPKEAVDLISQTIAANDKIAAHHAGIAEAYGALGDRDKAIAHYRKAVALEPGHWAAQHQLAALLFDRGDANAALEASARALAMKDTPEVRALFVQCVRNAERLPPVPEFRALMIRALREGWARPGELTGAAHAVIKGEPTVARGINAAMASWPRRLSAGGNRAADRRAGAGRSRPRGARQCADQRYRTGAPADRRAHDPSRRRARPQATSRPRCCPFACALARQCFINEYVFICRRERDGMVGAARQARSDGRRRRCRDHADRLCVLRRCALDRTADLRLPHGLKRPARRAVREPEKRRGIAPRMPRLTAIATRPRCGVRSNTRKTPIRAGGAPVRPVPAGFRPICAIRARARGVAQAGADILIAGCGTGQQPIDTAQRFPQRACWRSISASRVLPMPSARRRARRRDSNSPRPTSLRARIDRSFDMIESSGVLHHLADPMRGWSTLVRCSSPAASCGSASTARSAPPTSWRTARIVAERGYAAPSRASALRQT
jgi:Tfp pilus assembly protein PilF/SAM-dependent methyltransferase